MTEKETQLLAFVGKRLGELDEFAASLMAVAHDLRGKIMQIGIDFVKATKEDSFDIKKIESLDYRPEGQDEAVED